jgi:hypothetical protein
MHRMEFEANTPVFERTKTVRTSDRDATAINSGAEYLLHKLGRILFFFLGVGVRLSPLGTLTTNWPIVPTPDDR